MHYLPEVHEIDKGIYPNGRPEKQVAKPVVTPQTCILPETKTISHIEPRIGQGRAGIKRKTLQFPVPQLHDKPEQPKLLSGRKPIIQIAERPPLQQSQNITQSKTRSKFSTPECLGHHDKVIPVPNYTIPQTLA